MQPRKAYRTPSPTLIRRGPEAYVILDANKGLMLGVDSGVVQPTPLSFFNGDPTYAPPVVPDTVFVPNDEYVPPPRPIPAPDEPVAGNGGIRDESDVFERGSDVRESPHAWTIALPVVATVIAVILILVHTFKPLSKPMNNRELHRHAERIEARKFTTV